MKYIHETYDSYISECCASAPIRERRKGDKKTTQDYIGVIYKGTCSKCNKTAFFYDKGCPTELNNDGNHYYVYFDNSYSNMQYFRYNDRINNDVPKDIAERELREQLTEEDIKYLDEVDNK